MGVTRAHVSGSSPISTTVCNRGPREMPSLPVASGSLIFPKSPLGPELSHGVNVDLDVCDLIAELHDSRAASSEEQGTRLAEPLVCVPGTSAVPRPALPESFQQPLLTHS